MYLVREIVYLSGKNQGILESDVYGASQLNHISGTGVGLQHPM